MMILRKNKLYTQQRIKMTINTYTDDNKTNDNKYLHKL